MHIMGRISELNLVKNAPLFVEFFFVLSGFVISHSFIRKLTSPANVIKFIKKRFARL